MSDVSEKSASEGQKTRPYAAVLNRLKEFGLRPTRQRLALGKLLFEEGNRHVTAENLHAEARSAGVQVSLATVYNTLNQFRDSGMLREVVVEAGRSYFDTNTSDHHHFFSESTGELTDIPADAISVMNLPQMPAGQALERVDVIVRLRQS